MSTPGAITVGKTPDVDLYAPQGATYSLTLNYKNTATGEPIDLTGYTARMSVRRTVEDPIVLLSLTTENGRITITGATGVLAILVPAADMESVDAGEWVYDMELVAGSVVTRLFQGKFIVEPNVTR